MHATSKEFNAEQFLQARGEDMRKEEKMLREEDGGRMKKGDETVPFYKLFSFADTSDVALMTVGTVAAVANGISMSLVSYIFGQLVNTFGFSGRASIVHEVSKVGDLLPPSQSIFSFITINVSEYLQKKKKRFLSNYKRCFSVT